MTAWCVVKVGDNEFVAEGEIAEIAPLLQRFLGMPEQASPAAAPRTRGRARSGPPGELCAVPAEPGVKSAARASGGSVADRAAPG